MRTWMAPAVFAIGVMAGCAGDDPAVIDVDAPVAIDAAIDAAPDPVPLELAAAGPYRVSGVVNASHHTGFLLDATSPTAVAQLYLDGAFTGGVASPAISLVTIYPSGAIAYVASGVLYVPGALLLSWPDCRFVAEPGGGTVGLCSDGELRHWTTPWSEDATFGGDGTLAVPGPWFAVVTGGSATAPTLTVASGGMLRRFDVHGAPDLAFGGTGAIAIPGLGPLAIYPLSGDRLVVIGETAAADQVTVQVIGADGSVGPAHTVALGRPMIDGGTDDRDRVTLYLDATAGRHYFARIDVASGALDPSFGDDGLADFADRPAGTGSTTSFGAVGADGRAYLIARGMVPAPMGGSYPGVAVSRTPYP